MTTSDGPPDAPAAEASLHPRLAAALVFFASGGVLVIEVVALRLVAPYVGVALQTSSAVIGVALAAIALGAWTGGRLADLAGPRRLIAPNLVVAGLVTCLTLPLVRLAGPIRASSDPLTVTLLAFIAVFAPCVFLAAVPPMVVKLQLRDLHRTGTVVGRLSGIGTLGAIEATFLTGFVLLAAAPTSLIFLAVGGAAVVVGLVLGLTPGGWRRPPATLVVLGLLGLLLPPFTPSPCGIETAYHCARVVQDPARTTGRLLVLDTLVHSYVDLSDPTYLQFPYIQAIGSVADVVRPAGQPLRALHLGAGGLTMPRYLAATRPGTQSRVLEVDPGILRLDRAQLGLRDLPGLRIDLVDGRVGLREEPSNGRDLVVGDAFGGLAVPWQLTTREEVREIARVLRPDGVYAVNVIDFPPNRFVHAEAATIAAVFPQVAVVAEATSVQGTTGGNYVVLASAAPLPIAAVADRLGQRGSSLEVASGPDFNRFASGAPILTDDYAPVDQMITPIRR